MPRILPTVGQNRPKLAADSHSHSHKRTAGALLSFDASLDPGLGDSLSCSTSADAIKRAMIALIPKGGAETEDQFDQARASQNCKDFGRR